MTNCSVKAIRCVFFLFSTHLYTNHGKHCSSTISMIHFSAKPFTHAKTLLTNTKAFFSIFKINFIVFTYYQFSSSIGLCNLGLFTIWTMWLVLQIFLRLVNYLVISIIDWLTKRNNIIKTFKLSNINWLSLAYCAYISSSL